jgi:hypothetical protein
MVANLMILQDLPDLQVSRIAGTEMKNLAKENPSLRLGVCGYEEATLIFYSAQNITRFRDAADLISRVPFARRGWEGLWPARPPSRDPYVIAVDEKTLQELQRHNILYTEMPRSDTPKNLDAYRISGFNVGNFKPVTITLISNQAPPEEDIRPRAAAEPASATTLPRPDISQRH